MRRDELEIVANNEYIEKALATLEKLREKDSKRIIQPTKELAPPG